MRLSRLARRVEGVTIVGKGDPALRGLSEDSRLVKRGDLFFALNGAHVQGGDFAAQAVRRGAVAVAVEDRPLVGLSVPQWVVPDERKALADAAHLFHGRPSRKLWVVGVTGTKGKTTTAYLLRFLLSFAGRPAGLLGTVRYETGRRSLEAPNTTPSALTVASLLSEMVRSGMKACAMEVSSHALEMDRVRGVEFRGAVFTNLSREHLDYHHTFRRYFEAKRRLFTEFPTLRSAAVNADDPWGKRLLSSLKGRAVGFGAGTPCAYRAASVAVEPRRISFRLAGRHFEAPLSGAFNVPNALGALAILRELGLPWDALQEGLRQAPPPPGRFERVECGQDFTVLVDYAHSPAALEAALRSARALAGRGGRVGCLFGCGGDRDRTKRPIMGGQSARLADYTVLTSDNPRTEDPKAILEEILRGVPKALRSGSSKRVWVEADRREAIRRVLSGAHAGDVVLLAGKGHEAYQIVGEDRKHFDDREEARKALRALGFKGGRP